MSHDESIPKVLKEIVSTISLYALYHRHSVNIPKRPTSYTERTVLKQQIINFKNEMMHIRIENSSDIRVDRYSRDQMMMRHRDRLCVLQHNFRVYTNSVVNNELFM